MDRRAPRGGGRLRRERAGAADRPPRRVHGHRRAGRGAPPQRSVRRQEVARPRPRHLRAGPARGHGQRVLPGGRQRPALRRRRGVQPHGHQHRPAAAPDRAGGQRRPAGLGGRGADPARRRRWARPAQGHRRAALRRPEPAQHAGPRRCAAGGVAAQRGRSGDPARRPGSTRGAGRGARGRGEARRADGADPQGQGGPRGRQRVRDRPVGPDRQPRHRQGVRGLRRARARRHRLPLPRLPAGRGRR